MATYKVPQDVEAEDKLIGPFSFRQFIYVIISVCAGAASFFLIVAVFPLPLLSVVTLPVFAVFAVIALPLRKDQPMELYVLAMVRFFLKPKRRIWNPDGTTTGMIIEVPRTVEVHLSKDITQVEAATRLSRLSDIVDTRGWAAKGVSVPQDNSVNAAVANETFEALDVLDDNSQTARSFDNLMNKQQQNNRASLMQQMQQQLNGNADTPVSAPLAVNPYDEFKQQDPEPQPAPQPEPEVQAPITQPDPAPATAFPSYPSIPEPTVHYNPYPQSIHQKVIDPNGKKVEEKPAEPPVTQAVSPAIMNLANNNDLSIEAIAHEAQRLVAKEEGEEVMISLR